MPALATEFKKIKRMGEISEWSMTPVFDQNQTGIAKIGPATAIAKIMIVSETALIVVGAAIARGAVSGIVGVAGTIFVV